MVLVVAVMLVKLVQHFHLFLDTEILAIGQQVVQTLVAEAVVNLVKLVVFLQEHLAVQEQLLLMNL